MADPDLEPGGEGMGGAVLIYLPCCPFFASEISYFLLKIRVAASRTQSWSWRCAFRTSYPELFKVAIKWPENVFMPKKRYRHKVAIMRFNISEFGFFPVLSLYFIAFKILRKVREVHFLGNRTFWGGLEIQDFSSSSFFSYPWSPRLLLKLTWLFRKPKKFRQKFIK